MGILRFHFSKINDGVAFAAAGGTVLSPETPAPR
jgi:hypothetical protein